MGKELTIRGIIIGVVITLVFTAANVYFGLKAGLTFSTSIPAAVISMALLRGFKDATVQENNIVQTIASAAGTLSSIIFVLPGLIMPLIWHGIKGGFADLRDARAEKATAARTDQDLSMKWVIGGIIALLIVIM